MTGPDDGWTADRPATGLVVHQPRAGFRYGAEAFWLVGFALEGGTPRTALDLGTGSGIGALLLARRGVEVLGLDVRPEWGPGWARTLAESDVGGRARLVQGDVATAALPTVDLVVSNPPFFPAGSGPEPADPWRRAARFEGSADVPAFVRAACGALAPGGRACLVVPVEREADVLAAAPPGFGPTRRARVGDRRVLVELAKGGGGAAAEVVDPRGARAAAWYASATLASPLGRA